MSILDRIAAHKRLEVEALKKQLSEAQLLQKPRSTVRDFAGALLAARPAAIIAEIKRASPVKGLLCADFDVSRIAKIYAEHHAACLSVLTDSHFFQGAPDYLQIAKEACPLPVLRKDFIIDAWQIAESYALGADCILLIASLLDDTELRDFCEMAQALKLHVLVESHTAEEFERALRLPTPLMGVNNRSLHDFDISLTRSIECAKRLPDGKILVAESGIHTRADIELLQSHQVQAFLIGESLMRAEDPGLLLETLAGKQ
ncbi:indole-3-glycerol phosphate synthase TrpC [Legionella geestiana]|uniref:indole-3-glycerol phosphate synthase TrpC n=1 Tax=Legionella geestiana TaxID=45065 RepID=UPI001091CAE9|nr:indole-3-glycerol phosphate synthase TrpC [Legionella geestiana]QDQ38944.1 indole-3-glycerol phosphate synthase TrpC [Legionella geestiana]